MPMAEKAICRLACEAPIAEWPVSGLTCADRRYIITMPRPLSSVASGSSSGSAHGANFRMARWAPKMMTR